MAELRLSPDEARNFRRDAERMDEFIAGVQALATHLKKQKLDEIIAARQVRAENPEEGSNGKT
jgi:hypothetical protein